MLKWLLENKLIEAGRVMEKAAEGGWLEFAKYLEILNGFDMPKGNSAERKSWTSSGCTMSSAVSCGSLDTVRWLFETFRYEVALFGGDPRIIDTAASMCVKYLHELATMITEQNQIKKRKRGESKSWRCPSCTTSAMDQAATYYHIDVVQWLHENRKEGCTAAAIDGAAANGHFGMVKWLFKHRTEGCTTKAMDMAAQNGHLDVVRWLHYHVRDGCTTEAMDSAACAGHLRGCQWLHTHRSEGCSTKAMDEAARTGDLEMIKWLHYNRSEGCSTDAMDNAAACGKLEVVKWLHRNRSEGCTSRGPGC
ncbi:unnamed protein product [Phytophthora lilii]|uniref:Unnamed protein product n=1 Tax=Phytophthora lilii TaxID=2077276 RepID=A0A9W6TYI0_9STRA|nr:unnamed protein product [Phytophthora lilii]